MQIRIAFGIVFALFATVTPEDSLLIGAWQVNLSRSTLAPGSPPYKRSTCRIEPQDDGVRVIYDMVGIRGGVIHLEWTGKLDGKDYPVQGMDEVITNAYTRVDDHIYDIVVKVDGNRASTARTVIAKDRKSMTTTTTSRNPQGQTVTTTVVYERK
jgi:hypothetical protein